MTGGCGGFFLRTALLVAALLVPGVTPATATPTPDKPPAYDLVVHLDPTARQLTVTGHVNVTVAPETPAVILRLNTVFTVNAMAIDGQPVRAERTDGHLRVPLAPSDRLQRRITFSYAGPIAAMPQAGNETAALMAGGWGAVLEESGHWYPRLSDRPAHFRVRLRTPAPFRAVTTGAVTNEIATGTGFEATFDTIAPVQSLTVFAGQWQTDERTVSTTNGTVTIRTWLRAHQRDLAPTYLDAAARHLKGYAGTIGAYPFGAFHVVGAPFPVGLAYPGLTYIGEQVLGFRFVPETSLRHEVLHAWWGGGIEIDYTTGNWAEGLTTYMADYARAREQGESAARDMRLDWLRDYAALPLSDDRPATAFTTKTHDASQIIGYNKVAFFFHMLERKIGRDAFDAALRKFWQAHAHGRDRAGWADLQSAFEDASGEDLKTFFGQWLHRTGAPLLALETARLEKTDAGFEAIFTLTQTQAHEAPKNDTDTQPYALEVPVVLETDDGRKTQTLQLAAHKQTFRIASRVRPRHLSIDPGFDVFRRLSPGEAPPIFRDVTLHSKTRVVLTTSDEDAKDAMALARALLSHPVTVAPVSVAEETIPPGEAPLLIIGTPRETGLTPARPHALPSKAGPVDAWVGHTAAGRLVMVIAASGSDALRMAARRLPHYGRKSYVQLLAGRQAKSGALPLANGPLSHQFER